MKHAAVDPVCGMTVAADKGFSSDYRGTHYLFCSGKCKTKFDAEPERYLAPSPVKTPAPAAEYTCPMHPEIRQLGPGSCPKCGMALEPVLPDLATDEDNSEYEDFKRRFWGSLPLTVVVVFQIGRAHV